MRLFVCALLLLASGCLRLEATTRTERGPLLRTFERPQVVEGGVEAEVRAEWPNLKLTVVGYDTCRALTVEEYAEERITERASRAAGPGLSTGIANLMASAALLAVSFFVSDAPNTSVIDQTGRYGPSTRQYLQGTSLTTAIIGGPALAVGLIGLARSGEETEVTKTEQVVGQKDARCNDRPLTGLLSVWSGDRLLVTKVATDGAVDFAASELAAPPDGLRMFDRAIELDAGNLRVLTAFGVCVALEAQGNVALNSLSDDALMQRAEALETCRLVRGAELADAQAQVTKVLEGRPAVGGPPPQSAEVEVESYEQALSALRPTKRFTRDSADLALLEPSAALTGQAVVLEGVLAAPVTANIHVLQVGSREVFVFLQSTHPWPEVREGTRVEVVAVMVGAQTVGDRTLPVARAAWVRPAY